MAAAQPPAEEEALKRNTDCVYFLASPLTCKKGSDCEYRHSDYARVNPRDCWFWLNSNCLNPNCGFRHPPLDGLLGTQVPTSTGSAQPLRQTVTTPSVQIVDANSTQGVPCKFFQSGFCLKGDWCFFLHVPNYLKNKASVVPVKASATETSNLNEVEMPTLGKKVPPTNNGKPLKSSLDQQAEAGDMKSDFHMNEHSRNKRMSNKSCIDELTDYNNHPVSNGNLVNQLVSVQQPHQVDDSRAIDDKSVRDVSREPSPDGFDVLVDDEGRNSDFYHSEDRYGMSREYEAQNEYDIDHLADYNIIAEAGNDRYRYLHGYEYDSQRYPNSQCGLDRNRDLSERISAGPFLERRPYAMAELDLRYHLARNKQPHVLRSVVSHDQAREKYVDDHNHQRLQRHENSLSNRLRGRIKLPRGSLSSNGGERIRLGDNGRLYSVLVRDRIKGRVGGASVNGWKNDRGLHLRREMIGENNDDFAAPKSLAELKNRKNAEPRGYHQQQQIGKRKRSDQQNGGHVSFEGPKPLEEILKQKRGEISHRNSSGGEEDAIEDNNQKEGNNRAKNESVSSLAKKWANFFASVARNGAEESYNDDSRVASKVKAENDTAVESRADEEREKLNPEADCDVYDGEGEDEYLDGDEEEFAKKLSAVYS